MDSSSQTETVPVWEEELEYPWERQLLQARSMSIAQFEGE